MPSIYFLVSIILAIILGVVLYFYTKKKKPPKWSILFSFTTFVLSVIWIKLFSGIIVDFIGLVGIVLDIDISYLGITLLAFGNCVGDMVIDCGVAKWGMAQMAIVGCFAGPFFNICIGLGVSMLKVNINALRNNLFPPEWSFTKWEFRLPQIVIYA